MVDEIGTVEYEAKGEQYGAVEMKSKHGEEI